MPTGTRLCDFSLDEMLVLGTLAHRAHFIEEPLPLVNLVRDCKGTVQHGATLYATLQPNSNAAHHSTACCSVHSKPLPLVHFSSATAWRAAASAPVLHATQPRATEPSVSHATRYPKCSVTHRGTSLARWTATLRALHEERLAGPNISRRHRHIGFPVVIAMTEGTGRTPAEQHRLDITRLPWRSRKTWYSFFASVEL